MLQTRARERIEEVFDWLGLAIEDFDFQETEVRGACPIHGGNNNTAFCYYKETGVWRCYTRGCHEGQQSIIGLIKAVRKIEFRDAIDWLVKKLDYAPVIIDDPNVPTIKRVLPSLEEMTQLQCTSTPIPLALVKDLIEEDFWFTKQGFTKQTLGHFSVGYCSKYGKPMFLRSFAPVLSDDKKFAIGFTGRITLESCGLCGKYHQEKVLCEVDGGPKSFPKWKHYGFKAKHVLYNSWDERCIETVKRTGKIVLCEGPKDVWWLHQHGIFNSVGILGIELHRYHILKMTQMGVRTVILALDNDDGGNKGITKALPKLNSAFVVKNLSSVLEDGQDIADLKQDRVHDLVQSFLEEKTT